MINADYLQSPTCWFLFMVSLMATALLTPAVAWGARAAGVVDRAGFRRIAKGGTPLLGGLAIAIPFLIVCGLGLIGPSSMLEKIRSLHVQHYTALIVGGMAILVLGCVDDTRGLRARTKLVFQILAAGAVCLLIPPIGKLEAPLLGVIELNRLESFVIGVAWIVLLMNAFNLIDGVDGLASAVSLIISGSLLVLGAITNNTFMVVLCASLTGSLIAFLPFNMNPAKIFLGDTGSMFLGFILAAISMMGTFKTETAAIAITPILALGFPLFEAMISILRRMIHGQPVFAGDRRHTHHRLLGRGYSQNAVVLIVSAATFGMAGSAILQRIIPDNTRWGWMPFAMFLVAVGWIAVLAGYIRPRSLNRAIAGRQIAQRYNALSRYVVLSLNSSNKRIFDHELMIICKKELGLDLLEWQEADLNDKDKEVENPDSEERILALSPSGTLVEIRMRFARKPDDLERRAALHCLGNIFEAVEFKTPMIGEKQSPEGDMPDMANHSQSSIFQNDNS